MGLTEQQFSTIRQTMRLPDAVAKEDPTGKRSSARWTVDGIIAFARCREPVAAPGEASGLGGDPPAKWVSLIDLSPTGVSILSKTQLGPGEHFVVALPLDGEEHLPAVCTVQYSRVKLDGTFRVGAQFCEPAEAGVAKAEAAMAALREMGLFLIDPSPATSAAPATPEPRVEKRPRQSERRAERRLAEGRAIIHTYDEIGEPGPIEEVPALDFSETGVCIFRREPLHVGDHFMARVPVLNAPPIISLCRVSNCTACESDARYRIGAEFVQPAGLLGRLAKRVFRLFKPAA